MLNRVSVVGCGMVTCVGFNAAATCAVMRARVRNVKETNLWDPQSGEYVSAGRVELPHWWIGIGKLAELVAPAISECLVAARPRSASNVPILLGVCPSDRPHRFSGLDDQILDEIEYRLGFRIHPRSEVIARDRVSAALALSRAREWIVSGEFDMCVVAGVDSFLDQPVIDHYLTERRILTPASSNGFSPGEAGSAILVAADSGQEAGLHILGIGLANEKATIETEQPLLGNGLTSAIGSALGAADLRIEDVDYRISDLNGEHYRFKEMVLAMIRYERKRRERRFDLWHPIEYIGDVGAAIGPLLLGVALVSSRMKYGVGPTVLLTLGNDNGDRAAIVASSRRDGTGV